MPATTYETISAGPPTLWAAAPVATKIPAPMIAPTPRAVSWTGAENPPEPVLTPHLLEKHGERLSGEELVAHAGCEDLSVYDTGSRCDGCRGGGKKSRWISPGEEIRGAPNSEGRADRRM